MFEHIGKKVKFFSQALFWLGAAASVLLGLVVAHVTGTLWMFLLIALTGCVGSYLSVAVLYMLAQIADNSEKQLLALSRLETLLQKTDASDSTSDPAPETH